MNPHPVQAAHEDNDDEMVGQILSRRRALRALGIAGGLTVAGSVLAGGAGGRPPGPPPSGTGGMGTSAGTSGVKGLPGCVVRPAQTQGPYWVDERLQRRDIRSDTHTRAVKPGVPLVLTFDVSRVGVGVCEPRAGILVDVWHCDAAGVYSDAKDAGYDTRGQNFLRGTQLTDASGKATFSTIFPGWYAGRAVHIHYRLRVLNGSSVKGDFASQLFFDEAVTDTVHKAAPYRSKGRRDTLNANDMVYRNGGSQMLLQLKGSASRGYTATFDVGLNIA